MMKGFAGDGNRTSARGSSGKFRSELALFNDEADILSESSLEREQNFLIICIYCHAQLYYNMEV